MKTYKGLTTFILLLACLKVTHQGAVIHNILLGTPSINSVTTYQWQITFDSSTVRPDLNLTFPSSITLSPSTSASVGGTPLTASVAGNILVITNASLLFSTVTVAVNNVQNPNSAISTSSFSGATAIDGTFSLSSTSFIQFQQGSLVSSGWSFSACTEQPNSNLTITMVTTNLIPQGTNKLIINFGTWPNHNTKNLVSGVSSLSSLISIDQGSTYLATTSTSIDSANQITISYNQASTISGGRTLIFIILGVVSPPTQSTTLSASFTVATADVNGAKIDESTSITVTPTCVFTLSTGTFANPTMVVNSLYLNPQIDYSQTPTITMQASDTVELHFTPLANFNSCQFLKIWRNINNPIQAGLTASTTYYQYTLPSSNSQYSYSITLNPVCSNVLIPSSQTPQTVTFIFKRSGSPYMQLSAVLYPQAALIASGSTSSSLSTTQMTKTNVDYTFSVTISQGLGSNPGIKINNVPADVTVPAAPACTVTLVSGTVTSRSCLFDNSTRVLDINFTSTSLVAASTVINIVVSGITNPSAPTANTLGVQTYYSSSIGTSRVQYSASAFNVAFTGITGFPGTFAPGSMTVYTTTATTVTFTTTINLPSGSIIYIQFPVAATELSISNNPLSIDGVVSSSTVANNNNNSFTVTTSGIISAGSILTIASSIRSPSSLGSYNYIILRVTSGSTLYIQSTTSMFILVDSVTSMPAKLTPTNSMTGASSGYTIEMTVTVPHPTSFLLIINLPSDISFSTSGASCTGNCSGSITSNNFTSFQFQVDNNLNTTGHNLTFVLGSTFTNPRAIGRSADWTLTTSNIAPTSIITISTAAPTISLPNLLTPSFQTDSYYINNTNVVKMTYIFTNSLVSTDYILFIGDSTTYSELTTITCSGIYGTCTKDAALSSNGSFIIRIVPNVSSIVNNTLNIVLEGLISGTDSVSQVTVRSFNNSGNMIDEGTATYTISCLDSSLANVSNNCKTCHSNQSCIDCYTTYGFYLSGNVCVSDCGLATSYSNFNGSSSGTCQSCINNCFTCLSATICITCQSGYYYYADQSCRSTCVVNGYVAETIGGNLYCNQCFGGGLCLQCTSSAAGDCTLCTSTSVLSNGLCSTSCANNSMYASGGFCYNCDVSCSTCTAGGNGGCLVCAVGYFSYNNFCLAACPTDTVANSNGTCTCDLPCTKCVNTTTFCTACNDSAMFISQGQCLSSCPTQTYLSGSTCISCSTGCTNCSSSTCFQCIANNYLYNNLCYSDCNLIGQQYDVTGSTCVLCPDGCDTCSGTVCTSCLSSYTLSSSSSQCIQTCLLTNSCSTDGEQVLPLPGLIALVVWTIIVVAIKLILGKNYVPYSLILFSSVAEFILVIVVLSQAVPIATISITRLLAASDEERTTLRALLGTSIAMNYLTNICYVVIFIKYIRPLMSNPRQIDFISNVVVIVIAALTNYRFALIAFAKMFPKPFIHIANPSKLTPVHYLAIASLLLDLIPIAACGIAIYNENARSNIFMLSIDLLIIIAFNVIVTIWFVACSKPDQYYDDEVKKYQIQEHHDPTHQTIGNDKDMSKANIVGQDTFNFTDDDINISNDKGKPVHGGDDSYKKLRVNGEQKRNYFEVRETMPGNTANQPGMSGEDQDYRVIPVRGNKNNRQYDPYSDPNYQVGLKPKKSSHRDMTPTKDRPDYNQTLRSDGKNHEAALFSRAKVTPLNYSKEIVEDPRPERDEDFDEQIPDLNVESQMEKKRSIFDPPAQRVGRPKRTGADKKVSKKKEGDKPLNEKGRAEKDNLSRQRGNTSKQKGKVGSEKGNMGTFEKGNMGKGNKVGYFQSQAFESNAEDDIESIIRQKVFQSTIKNPKKNSNSSGNLGSDSNNLASQSNNNNNNNLGSQSNNNSDMGNEEISPSWFNIQNQRIQLSDFGQNNSET